MLPKCANPACSIPFRYFRDGQILVIEERESNRGGTCVDEGTPEEQHPVKYFWLCRNCCREMSFGIDEISGAIVVRRRGRASEGPVVDHRAAIAA